MNIRHFTVGDEPALHALFLSATHGLASRDYSAEQIAAWAPVDLNPAVWAQPMRDIQPFVVERGDEVIAYADVQESGYIDHFFVAAPWAGQGVGRRLMQHLQATAMARRTPALTSDVSRTAQAFYRRFGFVVVEQRLPVVRGVVVPNALMRKALTNEAR